MRALKSLLAVAALLLALCHGAPAYAQLYAAPSCGAIRWDWRLPILVGRANTQLGSAVLSNVATATFNTLAVGMLAAGDGVGAGATVTAFDATARTVTLSVASTQTLTNIEITFTHSAAVHYKPAGAPATSYVQGPAIVHDYEDAGFRGVIPNLQPNAGYDIRLTLNSNPPQVAEKLNLTTLEWQFIPTFHSVGMCWAPDGKGAAVTAEVRFKPAGSAQYRRGLDLWYDARTNLLQNAEYRGSLVELQPGTSYDVELKLSSGLTRTISNAVTTWSESFPVPAGNTVLLGAGITRLIIAPATVPAPTSSVSGTIQTINVPNSGSASSYSLVTGSPGQNVIDQEGLSLSSAADACVTVKQGAHHVIIRGLKLANCQRQGIHIERQFSPVLDVQTSDIVIEDNEIVGWGGKGQDNSQNLVNMDAAIMCNYARETGDPRRPDRIIIQGNAMHDPRFGSNPWGPDDIHPRGPQPIIFTRCGTNHVIRYNDIYSGVVSPITGEINHYNDGLGGGSNFSSRGFPSADSDVYGNRISHAYDDAIEVEGGNRNVRVWGNFMDRTMVAIGNAHTSIGPLYVWRNVSNDMSRMTDPNPALTADTAGRGSFVKIVSGTTKAHFNGGRAYFFHNTVLQPPNLEPNALYPLGAGNVLGDAGPSSSSVPFHNFMSRNNLWQTFKVPQINGQPKYNSVLANCNLAEGRWCDANFDIYNGKVCLSNDVNDTAANCENTNFGGVTNRQGWRAPASPTYARGGGSYPQSSAIPAPSNNWVGDFRLAADTVGTNNTDAVLIHNFNDLESTRNSGAQPAAQELMRFGTGVARPQAALSAGPLSGTAPFAVSFDANGSKPGAAPIAVYSIDYGDNASGSGVTQSHTYTAAGTFVATLTVTDASGRAATATQTVTVTAPVGPAAALNASPLSGTAPLTVSFDASGSTPGSAPISSYSINFGDNTSGTGVTQSHTYGAAGTYQAILTVTDANGRQSSAPKTITVTADSQPPFAGSSSFRLFVTAGPGLIINRAAGERIDFTARAADGRALSRVRFFLQGAHRLTDTAAPFEFSWIAAPTDAAGSYVMVAEATDTAGNVAVESRSLTLLANACSLFASSGSVTHGESVFLQGVCSSTQTPERVEFFVDDILQSPHRDVATPYTWTMDTSAFALGTRVVKVRGAAGSTLIGEDSANIQITAAPLTLTFSTGPVVHRTENLDFTVTATDGRALRQVDFYVNGEFRNGENIAPYTFVWPASGSSARPDRFGRHQLHIQATDVDGNVLTATRDLYVLSDTCNVLLGTSKYGVTNHDTVLAGPHTIIQGQRMVIQGLCTSSQTVQQMEFYVDGVQESFDSIAPWGIQLSTASFAPGPHTVSITARLPNGASASHSIPIEIVAPRP